jgi:hypothetical protein
MQIAPQVLQLHAALGHEDRRDGEIALRRDVPVVRHGDLEAALRGLRVDRREHAAAAAVLERKGGDRESEDRHVVEAQARVQGRALLFRVIEVDLGGLQHPVVAPGLAGGEGGVLQAVAVAIEDDDLVGAAARRTLALQEVFRGLDAAAVLQRVVVEARAVEAIEAALQAHAALALHTAELRVEAQHVAEDRGVVAADLGASARRCLEVADAFNAFCIDDGRALPLRGGGALRKRCNGEPQRQQRDAVAHDRGAALSLMLEF